MEYDHQTEINSSVMIIPFWPHSDPNLTEREKKQRESMPMVTILLFAFLWLLVGVAVFNIHITSLGGGIFNLVKVVPFAFLAVYSKASQATRLKLTPTGIRCESVLAGVVSVKQKLSWAEIASVSVTTQKQDQRLLDRYVVFQPWSGKPLKIKLEKIATGEHWQQLLSAVKKYSQAQLIDVDPQLFTNLNVAQQDPTYTQLWLDALLAPPKRDKLQALNSGSSLKQGDYVIVGKLGAGGQGSAYLANRSDGGKVVLKEYIFPLYVDNKARRRALESFEHEAAMLSKLDSSAIVKLEDCFVEDHRGYLVLEHIPGLNLRELVERDGPLDESNVRELGVKMCDVLSYLHDQSPQIVHRDFTPDNLILMPDGSLKLIDFMVAQENSDSATACVVGKHAYLPPEQFRGRAVAQSDVYALGATLYYLLTGKDPQPLTSSHPILERDTVSGVLDSTVARATDLDLSRRFSSAREVKQSLLDVYGETISLNCQGILESG